MEKIKSLLNERKISQLKKLIDNCKYISFDLFDTLIKRDCCRPTELFSFVEKKVNQEFGIQSHFAQKRIKAEIDARNKSKSEEVTLSEIYNELAITFSNQEKKEVMQWEEEYEYSLCQWNPFIKPIYTYCQQQEKKIIIVTDIYLSENLIRRILAKLEIDFDVLFISSLEGKTKSKGSLFQEVLLRLGAEPDEILHIGDNRKSDYFMPKKIGMHSFHFPKNINLNLFVDKKIYKQMPEYADLCSFINNHASAHKWDALHPNQPFDYFAEVGYEVLGPVLYGFVNWLQTEFEKDKIDKVFFLARDGQLMQKAYQKLSTLLPNTYMFASRKALIIPSLWMNPSLQEVRNAIFWGRRGTISEFLKKIGLNPIEFEQNYKSYSFSLQTTYEYEELWKNPDFLYVFENKVKDKMVKHSRKMYNLVLEYLQQINFKGRVAIIDIGWYGHMQRALDKIINFAQLPVKTYGYYLGIRPESPMLNFINSKGYLFDKGYYASLSEREKNFNAIVEMLFSANHGTTRGYKKIEGKIEPDLSKWEYSDPSLKNDYANIQACQVGALNFIDDIMDEKECLTFENNPFVAFSNWLQMGEYPSTKVATHFGDLHFMDNNIACLAKPNKFYFYIFHPKAFILDFRDSSWRIGFLTRVFGDQIPYTFSYRMLRKCYFLLKGKI